jgi:hypothetical protein
VRPATAPTSDPVVEDQRRERHAKLARIDATLRQQRLLTAADSLAPEDRELVAAALSEPEPRELLTPGQQAAPETKLVQRRAPEAVRARFRARAAWDAAGRLRNLTGQTAYFTGDGNGGLSYRVAEVDAEGRLQVTP